MAQARRMSSDSESSGEFGRRSSIELYTSWPYVEMIEEFYKDGIRYGNFKKVFERNIS